MSANFSEANERITRLEEKLIASDKAELLANVLVRLQELEDAEYIKQGQHIVYHAIWATVVFLTPIVVVLLIKFIK